MKGSLLKYATTLASAFASITLATAACASGGSSEQSPAPAGSWAPITHVYAPKGFDSNDETQVIVSGYLPNLCFKSPRSKVSVEGQTIFITVTALTDRRSPFCLMVIVPFLETVTVGVLDKGDYKIVVNAGSPNEIKSRISVEESESLAVDNHVYAAVDAIDRTPVSRKVLLKGYNVSPCFNFDHVEFISNGEDTFSVLPIMKQSRPRCPMKMTPFAIETEAPATLSTDQVLLHVRSMDGRSVNALIDNRR